MWHMGGARHAELSPEDAADLAAAVGDRLILAESPLQPCLACPDGTDREAVLSDLRNPFFIEDHPGAFHTTGWFGAYQPGASRYVVATETAADIAAAVSAASAKGIPLAIKGTGHDYLGRSSAPAALLIWTHRMRDIEVHDVFVPAGAVRDAAPEPAISLGAGVRWLEAYQALAKRGRYVQGGGCTTVGAAGGFTQGGGFGSFSRRYGTAASNVLEAEVVTAAGEIIVANENLHPDLFWALRGGGGGTFGVVSRITMRTFEMPRTLGRVTGRITARGSEEFRRLVYMLARFLGQLCDGHWGEHVSLTPQNRVEFGLMSVDLDSDQIGSIIAPITGWLQQDPDAYACDLRVRTTGFGALWDAAAWDVTSPGAVIRDGREGAIPSHFWWGGNQWEVSWYINAFQSWWLPRRLLDDSPGELADALFAASRRWPVRLDFNKALSGADPGAVARCRATAMNPAALDAAALVLAVSAQQFTFPGLTGHEPDAAAAETGARGVAEAMRLIRDLAPGAGTYLNECDYFEPDWQSSFWGSNYPRLLDIKRRYDPMNIFRVHHGVGTEAQPVRGPSR
jgi:FAD/FMN-containing dehydrogenase